MKRTACLVLLSLALSLSAPAQRRRSVIPGNNGVGAVIDAVATFDGTFKSADKKFVLVEVESGDTMRMYITRTTHFIRDGKEVKSSEFHEGDPVTADATRDARLNMLAVKIENRKPAAAAPKQAEPNPF